MACLCGGRANVGDVMACQREWHAITIVTFIIILKKKMLNVCF